MQLFYVIKLLLYLQTDINFEKDFFVNFNLLAKLNLAFEKLILQALEGQIAANYKKFPRRFPLFVQSTMVFKINGVR